jgi:hypothetical protein
MIPVKVRSENNESNADRIVSLLKYIDMDSVDLQHAARDIWVTKILSD